MSQVKQDGRTGTIDVRLLSRYTFGGGCRGSGSLSRRHCARASALRGDAWWKGHRSMPESDAQMLPIGMIVHSRYQISAVVGRGGLGTVYQVVDVLFSKHNVFALKELVDQSSGARKQFELESQWLQSLDHNHIPKVREHFEWQQRLYLVMDFVEGENLEQKLTRLGGRPLPERQVIQWILPICDALHYLHTRVPPILHRDVKPANIIVTPGGHPVLVDLGIAKEHLPGARMTATFVRKAGTEGYAPPEQYSTAGQTGPWSDVYGLGATLYHLLTGQIPPTAVERVALDTALVSPRILNGSVSRGTDAAIYRALALRPSERFRSILEFKRALVEAVEAIEAPMSSSRPLTTQSTPTPLPPHPQTPPSRSFGRPYIQQDMRSAQLPSDPYTAIQQNSSTSPLPTPSPSPLSAPTPPHISEAPLRTGKLSSSQPGATSAHLAAVSPGSSDSVGRSVPYEQRKRRAIPSRFLQAPVLVVVALSLVIVGATAAFAAIRASAPPDRSSPSATVNGYLAALRSQDYARAWLFVSASRNNGTTQAELINELRSDDARFGVVRNVAVISTEVDGAGKATVQIQVTRDHALNTPMTFTLVVTQYDGNTWLIDSISSA